MGEKLDLITIGESLIELSSDKSLAYADTLEKYYGGDTLCTAVAASRLGSKAGYITLSLFPISEPTRPLSIPHALFCL